MIYKSQKLAKVSYDIRGPIYQKSQEILRSGESILQLNIGNPAAYGFHAPKHLIEAVSSQIEKAQGYVSSNGIDEARAAPYSACACLGQNLLCCHFGSACCSCQMYRLFSLAEA
jgi:alanine-synthesizing transaminase